MPKNFILAPVAANIESSSQPFVSAASAGLPHPSAEVSQNTSKSSRPDTVISGRQSLPPPFLPVEVWSHVIGYVPPPFLERGKLGDFASIRRVCKSWNKESLRQHRQIVEQAASRAAMKFLCSYDDALMPEAINVLRRTKCLNLNKGFWYKWQSQKYQKLQTILGETRGLLSLDISGLTITADGLRKLPIAHLQSLQRLNLCSNEIDEDGDCDLPIGQLQNLQMLDLSTNFIGDAGARDLPIGQLDSLHSLDLSHNQIGAAGIRELPIAQLQKLRALFLDGNQIGDNGARDLPIVQLKNLYNLSLSGNQIGAAGARDLPISQLRSLKLLNLRDNLIGDAGYQLRSYFSWARIELDD